MTWADANQRHLVGSLAAIGERLDRHARQEPPGALSDDVRIDLDAVAQELDEPAAIDRVAGLFGLSPFERDTLLLLAGVELDATFSARCAAASGHVHAAHPTFALALGALPDAHWSALSPSAPLRYWKMIEIGPGDALTAARLRIDERILHYLTGIDLLDERLEGFVEPVQGDKALPPSLATTAERLAAVWRLAGNATPESVVHLTGPDPKAMVRIAGLAAAHMGLRLSRLHDDDIPVATSERELLTRLWERDAVLSGRVLLITHGEADARSRAAHVADALRTPVVLAGRDGFELRDRSTIPMEVGRPTAAEQRALWSAGIPDGLHPPDADVDAVVKQFDFGPDRIREAALAFASRAASSTSARLWDTAREHSRPRGETLAQRIEARATWSDLVLGDRQIAMLLQIAAQVRHRTTVYEDWGFGQRETRGLGISALFIGRSGTGKTLAAEVLANELALDLYRIDLSSVVSKYIGDTEKNLRRVFDDAESGGSILLFDEADALFGKRSEVKDSHDRYANIEVSYLLQRMEVYRGLAILTTNMKDALDAAFLRRIRFVVDFRYPDRELRERIWSGAFPAATPVDALEPGGLAQLSITGGNIRNVALNAAFMAAQDGAPVTMAHLARAARDEFEKLDRSLSEEVVRSWR